jgi:AraC family transcriptional regulator
MQIPKGNTVKEYQRRICRAMNYISHHLDEEPSLDEIAQAASFSKFHFHRLFRAIVGETVAEFIRRLKLERAACTLVVAPEKAVTAIAFDCGFSSSQNFAKAFKKHFGLSPSEFREQKSKGGNTDSKDRNAFPWHLRYDVDTLASVASTERRSAMDVKVKEMPEFHVAYVRHIGPYGMKGCGGAFAKLMQWAGPRGLANTGKFLGVCWDDPSITPPDKCRYDACITVPKDTATEGPVTTQTIPGGSYAVYHCEVRGNNFDKPWMELMRDWLPQSGYQPDDKPCYELYYNNGMEDPENKWILDICCPVKPL